MVTGDVPFDGETPVAVAIKHLQEAPLNPRELIPDIPPGFANIIMKCIRKSPVERYQSAGELIDELDRFMLNPDGDYGRIDETAIMRTRTQQTGSFGEQTNYKKVKQIENDIRNRSRNRKRETGIVIIAALFCVVLLVLGIVFLLRNMSNNAPVEDYEVDNFIGMALTEAQSILDEAGIKYDVDLRPSADVPVEQVMEQTPEAGTIIKPTSLTVVRLIVSEGADNLRLKDYAGENFNIAARELENMGYVVISEFVNTEDVTMNYIVKTDPNQAQSWSLNKRSLYMSVREERK